MKNHDINEKEIKFYFKDYGDKDYLEIKEDALVFNSDNWNDYYYYRTQFHLNYIPAGTNYPIYIGKMKIYLEGTNDTNTAVTKNILMDKLEETCYSVGQSSSFYYNLEHYLGKDVAMNFLKRIRDISLIKRLREEIESNRIYSESLLRESTARHAIDFFEENNLKYSNFTFNLFSRDNISLQIDFNFDRLAEEINIPWRINVIIGKNGIGKTNLLSNLAKVLSRKNKNDNKKFSIEPTSQYIKGNLEPKYYIDYLKFSKYISISSNLYDDFYINQDKAVYKTFFDKIFDISFYINKHKSEIEASMNNNDSFEYLDVISKISDFFRAKGIEVSDNAYKIEKNLSYNYIGVKGYNTLKSHTFIYQTIYRSLKGIYSASYEFFKDERKKCIEIVLKDLIFKDSNSKFHEFKIELDKINFNESEFDEYEKIYKIIDLLSSGQKSLFYMFVNLINIIDSNSLIVIDEPELHLHPNAISNFLKQFNNILDAFDSFAIVTTHSPLIVQEIPSSKVNIFRTIDSYPIIDHLDIETFGCSVNTITKEIFDVQESESNYREILKSLVMKDFTLESIQNLFDNSLSLNSVSYIINKIGETKDEKI